MSGVAETVPVQSLDQQTCLSWNESLEPETVFLEFNNKIGRMLAFTLNYLNITYVLVKQL